MGEAEHHLHSRGFMVHRHRSVSGGAARAAVFGVSDGLVSNVALILGVAAAAATRSNVLIAGIAGLLAGAASMAAGEYVSVKAQAELVERELSIERISLTKQPELETRELEQIYLGRGVEPRAARTMAEAVMQDLDVALEVHAREELGIDPDETGQPWAAAGVSFVAFGVGATIPLLPWFFTEGDAAVVASAALGLAAAAAVGVVLARFTERSAIRTSLRQVAWAAAACTVTYTIGTWLDGVIT